MAKATKNKQPNSLLIVLINGKKEVSFFEQVYDVVRLIHKGRVTSYGVIAAY